MRIRAALAMVSVGALIACAGAPPQPQPLTVAKARVPAKPARAVADLTGKVKAPASLISDHGAGVISNNGAGVIANNAAGALGTSGRFRLRAAASGWVPVGGRPVVLVDVAGKVQAGPVTTDQAGAFRFPAVATGKAWVLRADLGGGRTLEALARAGTGEAAVTPATTVALAVVRARVDDLEAADTAAVRRLATEVEQALAADEALLDLANPLGTFDRVAAVRPAADLAAQALRASPGPSTPSEGPTTTQVGPTTAPTGPLIAPSGAFAALPEEPLGLVVNGERVFVVLPSARSVRSDVSTDLPEVASLDFEPRFMASRPGTMFLYDAAEPAMRRFALGGTPEQPTCVAGVSRRIGIQPAPAFGRGAVDEAETILASTDIPNLNMGPNGEIARLMLTGDVKFNGAPAEVRAAEAIGPDRFWLATGAATDNLFEFTEGQASATKFTVPQPITDLALGAGGTLYVATSATSDGLYRLTGGKLTQMPVPFPVDRVAVTASGALRILSGRNLHRL